ncbi:MAG: hypothetical protein HY475_03480 [Candidatus Terrybacteria bacterium]|nr:hypothetical protein [Candidatus Terrybacteria bacterium]
MRPTLLVVLQCPWKRGSLTRWHPSVWRRELRASRTGRRLFREVIPSRYYRVRFVNANPTLAETPDGIFPPNLAHMRRQIVRANPDVILVCGRVAQRALTLIGRDLGVLLPAGAAILSMPHPAFRGLRRTTTESVKRELITLAVRCEKR